MSVSPCQHSPIVAACSHSSLEKFEGSVSVYLEKISWLLCDEQGKLSFFNTKGRFNELFKSEDRYIPCLYVKIYSPECDDWHKNEFLGYFPGELPLKFFLNKKESDKAEFLCPSQNKQFSLICQQLGSCDEKKRASFEESVEDVFMFTYKGLLGKYYRGALNEQEQEHLNIAEKIKSEYFPHSTITDRGLGK